MNKNIIKIFFILILCICPAFANDVVTDSVADSLLKNTNPVKPFQNTNYNYESVEKIPVKLKITEKVTTRGNKIYDNQQLTFTVRNPVKYKNKVIFNNGDVFTANVATYLSNGMNGIPAMIIVDNFKSNKVSESQLAGTYLKKGFNLTPLVYPLKWVLIIIPPTGFATNFIKGGHAKITGNDTVTVYYYPEWK